MKNAKEMLDFVRGRSEKPFAASPLFTSIYTQWLHKREWLLTSNDPQTIEDIIGIGQECGFIPFFETLWFEVGVMDYDEVREEISGDTRNLVKIFKTPKGEYTLVDRFKRYHSRHVAKHAFSTPEDLDAYEYIIKRSLDRIEQCRPALQEVIETVGDRAIPYMNATDPQGCFSLINSQDRIFLFMDEPDRMLKICELNEELSEAATRIAAECGFQVFFGGTNSSLLSPNIVETYCIPFLLKRRELIRELGGILYFHECGKMQNLMDAGVYKRLNPEVLEGFQPPPSGDIEDMAVAAQQLPESIVTKGNLDLNFLLNSEASEIKDACLRVLDGMKGRRHIMGGSCSALPFTPLKNFRAIVEAVEIANRKRAF